MRPEPLLRAAPDPADLVGEDRVHQSVYTDPDVFALEMRRIFGRAWIYLAHQSEIEKPGDFVVRHIGTQPVILSRGKDGSAHAILNRCSHRGATLCAAKRGSAPQGLQCPYHGWIFEADGRLRSVPLAEGYGEHFDKADHAISEVARLDDYRGFLFATLDPDAPPLTQFLGYMTSTIDNLVDRSPTGEVRCSPRVLRHHYRANWKMTFENVNDVVHPAFAHAASVIAANKVAQAVGKDKLAPTIGMMLANGKPANFFEALDMVTTPKGHSFIGGHMGAGYAPDTADEYTRSLIDALGTERAREVLGQDRHLTLLYPSSSWHARYQTIRIVRPVRVDLTEVIGFTFELVGAPEETRINAIEYCTGANSAASPVIADDLEIYERCFAGNIAGEQWVPMSRGNGPAREETNALHRTAATSERFIRNQFAAWADYMAT